jgi:hypothetical protein
VKNPKPCFQRQYKLSQEDALECHRQINEMLDWGIVEASIPSKISVCYNHCKKSSGARRAVFDLRRINKQLQDPFTLQLTEMNQLLHSIAGQNGFYYLSLDLRSGFLQILLKPG